MQKNRFLLLKKKKNTESAQLCRLSDVYNSLFCVLFEGGVDLLAAYSEEVFCIFFTQLSQ